MNASELHRKLLYCGYSDVTDYLRNSPLNRYIYQQLLSLRPHYGIETPIITVFNEIYYQCIRVQSDHKPGYEIKERYLNEEIKWLDDENAAELVFCFVLALIKKKCKLSFHDECFLNGMQPLLENSIVRKVTDDLMDFIERECVFIPYEYQTMTCPLYELPEHLFYSKPHKSWFWFRLKSWLGLYSLSKREINAWCEITDNYTESYIEDYLRLFSDKKDQEKLLSIMAHTFTPGYEYRGINYEKLEGNILNGEYKHQSTVIYHSLTPHPTFDPDEDYDQMFGANLEQQVEEAKNDLEEKYKQERDTLKQQLEQLKKSYEADLERIEAKYQEEIAGLKRDLAKKAKEQAVKVPVEKPMPKELVMTISEIVNDAKEWFHESGASELTNMLYRFATRNHHMEDELWKQIESIIPAVEKRNATQVDIKEAGQVNIGQKEVNNHVKDK